MNKLTAPYHVAPPGNLCDMLLRDLASLLHLSQLVKSSLVARYGKCRFSPELTEILDSVVNLCDGGEPRLREALANAGAVLPAVSEVDENLLIAGFIANMPVTMARAVLATEIVTKLRLLVQHIELRTKLTAETAVMIGQVHLSQSLLEWAAQWRNCAQRLRRVTVRARAQAYTADLDEPSPLYA